MKIKQKDVEELYNVYKKHYSKVVDNNLTDNDFENFMRETQTLEGKIYNELFNQLSKYKITPDLPFTIHKLIMMTDLDFKKVKKLYNLLGIKLV